MKLSIIKVGDEITCAFLNRLVDKANENELKPMAPLFKKATTNGTQLGIAGFPSVTPEVLQYGVIVSGWTLDNPINFTWIIPTDAAGAWRKGYSGGSGSGAWVSGSGITKVYLENPGAAVYPYSGYSNDTFAGNWNWLMQSGVVITYFPLNSGNFSGQYDPDTLEWVTEGIDIGWAMPTQKLYTWGSVAEDWVTGNNFVYINPVSLPDGGAPYPYTGDPIKCYLTTPINSIPSFPSGSGLVSGDVLSIISWVSYASGDVLVPECFAGPTISAGGAGGKHPLLDGNVNNDTFPNSPEPGAFIVGADTASGLKWDIFPVLSAPSILSLSGTDTVAWMPAGDDGEIPYVNSGTEMDWIAAPTSGTQFLGNTGGIPVWKNPPPGPPGATGPQGPQGPAGPSGSDGQGIFSGNAPCEIFYWNGTTWMWSSGSTAPNQILISSGISPIWLDAPTDTPSVLVYDYDGATASLGWVSSNAGSGSLFYSFNEGTGFNAAWGNPATGDNQIPYYSGDAIYYTPSAMTSGQLLQFNGSGFVWGSGVMQQVVTDVFWDTTSGILVKTYANVFVLSTDSGSGSYVSTVTPVPYYTTTSTGSGWNIDLALYCSGN
jgi:hypothetical protein